MTCKASSLDWKAKTVVSFFKFFFAFTLAYIQFGDTLEAKEESKPAERLAECCAVFTFIFFFIFTVKKMAETIYALLDLIIALDPNQFMNPLCFTLDLNLPPLL